METKHKKNSILIFLGIFALALISIFVVYYHYTISINPNPDGRENYEKTSSNEDVVINMNENKNALYIGSYSQENSNIKAESVFVTDLKLKEVYETSNKDVTFTGTLELTEELQKAYKKNIMFALYTKEFVKAYDYASEVLINYNLNGLESYRVFLYEVLQLKNYGEKTFDDKKSLLQNMISPEIILFMFTTFSNEEQFDVIANKHACMLFDSAIEGGNLTYHENVMAGIYTEMNIESAYFVVPENIDGYKILFTLNNEEYRLYYIRYKETGKMEIVNLKNMTNPNTVSYKEYYSVYGD